MAGGSDDQMAGVGADNLSWCRPRRNVFQTRHMAGACPVHHLILTVTGVSLG